jgi:hypothetical protein
MSHFKRTSIQLDPDVTQRIMMLYNNLSISEIIRLSMEYVLEKQPRLIDVKTQFKD